MLVPNVLFKKNLDKNNRRTDDLPFCNHLGLFDNRKIFLCFDDKWISTYLLGLGNLWQPTTTPLLHGVASLDWTNYLLEPSGTFFWEGGGKQRVFSWSEISSAISSHCVIKGKKAKKKKKKKKREEKRTEFWIPFSLYFHSLVISR